MADLLKATILGIGLLTGAALTAQAQSVSSLPPAGGMAVQGTGAPAASTQTFHPNPGGGSSWKEEHYQTPQDYAANPTYHPYSTSIGPKPGSHSSGVDTHYQATASDAAPSAHPYSSSGFGPRAN